MHWRTHTISQKYIGYSWQVICKQLILLQPWKNCGDLNGLINFTWCQLCNKNNHILSIKSLYRTLFYIRIMHDIIFLNKHKNLDSFGPVICYSFIKIIKLSPLLNILVTWYVYALLRKYINISNNKNVILVL